MGLAEMAYIKNSVYAMSYSKFRPSPPKELIYKMLEFIKDEIPGSLGCALDVGCGSGQSTEILAPHFRQVIGIDNNEEQLQEALKKSIPKNVTYRSGSAEELGEADGSVDLVTAGMAIHWFDLKQFTAEVGRVLRPNGVLAVYGYNFPVPFAGEISLSDIVQWVFKNPLRKYIPNESKHAYFDGYKGGQFSEFPFSKEPAQRFEFPKTVDNASVNDLVGYITTTSSFQNYVLEHGDSEGRKLLAQFQTQVAERLDKSSCVKDATLSITFPFFLLLSRKTVPTENSNV